jgi:ferritin-like metal-binding protein YciE
MAGYTSASALAQVLGQQDAHDLLQETLQEEGDAAALLQELEEAILSGDAEGEEMEEGEEEDEDAEEEE